jgi:hypothetical protein
VGKGMHNKDQAELLKLLVEAQNAFDELFAEGRIKSQMRVYSVKKLAEPHYYAVKLFSVKNLLRVFWIEDDESLKSFKTAVREAVLRYAK